MSHKGYTGWTWLEFLQNSGAMVSARHACADQLALHSMYTSCGLLVTPPVCVAEYWAPPLPVCHKANEVR